MSYTFKKLDKAQVEFSFTIPPTEYQADMNRAAEVLANRAAIKGFRPGHAPYDIVKQQLGEQKILETALEGIIQHAYFVAVKAEGVDAIGMPDIKVEKLAPGNDILFRATVALLPTVKLPDLAKIKVEKKPVAVGDKEVGDVLENLRKMQPKETPKTGASTKDDKLVIKMEMFIDKVAVEGGFAENHQVYLSEPHYIPGLAEQLVGLAKDETKEFTLKFPKDHYQKHLAGKSVDFKIAVKDVMAIEYATLDESFAKALGQESMTKLKELLLQNLTREAESKEVRRTEEAMLDQLIEKTTFSEIPEILIDSEKRKMFIELKNDLDRRGITIDDYLKNIKKSQEEIFADFAENATKRAKAALISRFVAKENNITVGKEDLDKEIAAIREAYPGEKQVEENLKRPEVLDTIAATIQNRKVIQFLKEKVLAE